MKRAELSRFTVSNEFAQEEEDENGMAMMFEGIKEWDPSKSFIMEIKLHNLIKVEDWYGN